MMKTPQEWHAHLANEMRGLLDLRQSLECEEWPDNELRTTIASIDARIQALQAQLENVNARMAKK